MLSLQGKYNSATIFTDIIDNESISQVMTMLNLESLKDAKIRMMPDIHAGAGCTIGTTLTLHNTVIPAMVGVDIGCGMLLARIKEQTIDFAKLDAVIQTHIPSGHQIHETALPIAKTFDFSGFLCPIQKENAEKSIGSLGGGNHFIEVNQDDENNLYIVVHSGSRHLGLEICKHYQDVAYHQCNHSSREEVDALIAELKAQNRHREIEKEIHKRKNVKRTSIPKDLCHLSGQAFQNYMHDMKMAQKYAMLNRQAILDQIIHHMNLTVCDSFSTIHNYIDTDRHILRKGAVSAQQGEQLLIPINMKDGSLICVGKGNPDWNCSAPHGAGRLMSRSRASASISMDDFTESMAGIYTTSVCESTLDESPFAYKPITSITDNITDTVDIVKQIKPVYNFKAH